MAGQQPVPIPREPSQAWAAEVRRLRMALAEAEAARAQAEQALRRAEERERRLGAHDPLTGLLAARRFHPVLEAEVERARRFGDPLGLMLLDVDDLAEFNAAHGREAGDQVLVRLGLVLRWNLRRIDSGFRYGAEEFAVLLPRCGRADIEALAERLRRAFAAERIEQAGEHRPLALSAGAALYRRGAPLESFIRSADQALYEAKRQGKNRVVVGGD